MKTLKFLISILAIPLGALMFVYAEIDDSPGGQLLGLIVAVSGVYHIAKSKFWSKK